jgi:hypothetical protein
VAGVARTSLVAGNEYRSLPVTQKVVEQLCHDFIQVDDPDVGKGSLSRILTKIAFEQFGVQYSQMENLGRTVALFTDHAASVQGAPTTADWTALLGVDLHQFMRIGFVAYAVMVNSKGSVARNGLFTPDRAPRFAPLTSDQAQDSGHSALVLVRSGPGFDLVAQDEIGAGVPGVGRGEVLAELGDRGGGALGW